MTQPQQPETLVRYDQVDGSNLAGMELLVRQVQFIEERTALAQQSRTNLGGGGSSFYDSRTDWTAI